MEELKDNFYCEKDSINGVFRYILWCPRTHFGVVSNRETPVNSEKKPEDCFTTYVEIDKPQEKYALKMPIPKIQMVVTPEGDEIPLFIALFMFKREYIIKHLKEVELEEMFPMIHERAYQLLMDLRSQKIN